MHAGSFPSSRRPSTSAARLALLGLTAASAGFVTPAGAAESGGGASLGPSAKAQADAIQVRKISCLRGCSSIAAAKPGATLRFQGPRLTGGKRVVYLGAAGPTDDVLAKLQVRRTRAGLVASATLPKRAHSGPVAIEVQPGVRSAASAENVTLPGEPAPVMTVTALTGPGPFFPIVGTSRFGTGTAAFGGARDHEGQDVFAKCGTPLVAAVGGTVTANAFHARAGNYVVIDTDGGVYDHAYMHLKAPATPPIGARVEAGAPVGEVGDTGRASGCHLHFELWEGHWQGVGGAGKPVDPLPTLRGWAAGPAVPARR